MDLQASALMDQFHLGDVECGVDPHGPGKFQSHLHRTDDPLDGKGTDEPGCHLLGLRLEKKFLGGKSHHRPIR